MKSSNTHQGSASTLTEASHNHLFLQAPFATCTSTWDNCVMPIRWPPSSQWILHTRNPQNPPQCWYTAFNVTSSSFPSGKHVILQTKFASLLKVTQLSRVRGRSWTSAVWFQVPSSNYWTVPPLSGLKNFKKRSNRMRLGLLKCHSGGRVGEGLQIPVSNKCFCSNNYFGFNFSYT